MQAQEIEHYLAELGAALQDQGIVKPVRLLLIGGAYMMLLADAQQEEAATIQYALDVLFGSGSEGGP